MEDVVGKSFYELLNEIKQFVRARNYGLYRSIADNRVIYRLMARLFSGKRSTVNMPEGYAIVLNPLYHGQFLSAKAVGEYEGGLRRLFDSLVKPGMVVYDIGANVGVFSLLFSLRTGSSGRVYAFEPEENNFECLVQSREVNKMSNLDIRKVCVSDRTGTILFDHRGGAFSGRIADDASGPGKHSLSEKPSISVDEFVFGEKNRPPDLIKIDVEGGEDKVIKGARRTLETYRPVVICEVHKGLCPSLPYLFGMLSESGYLCYDAGDYHIGRRVALESLDNAGHIVAVGRA